MLDDPVLYSQRRVRKVDGRSILGITRALEAAEADEVKDQELLRLQNDLGMSYSAIGRHYGISRQRATALVQRAMVRRLMLMDWRSGRELVDMERDYHNLYPRKQGADR